MKSRVVLLYLYLLNILHKVFSQDNTATSSAIATCTDGSFFDPITLSCRVCPTGNSQFAGWYATCYCVGKFKATLQATAFPIVGGFSCQKDDVLTQECYYEYDKDGSIIGAPPVCTQIPNLTTQATKGVWSKRYIYEGFGIYYQSITDVCNERYIDMTPKLRCQNGQTLSYDYDFGAVPKFKSQFLIHHFDDAYLMLKDYNYHQKLANLCALTVFQDSEDLPCGIYKKLIATKDPKYSAYSIILPTTYLDSFNGKYNVHKLRIPGKETEDIDKKAYINFKLIVYDLEGNIIETDETNKQFANLDNQLFLCPSTDRDGWNLKEFGSDFQISCNINIEQFTFYKSSTKIFELLIETDNKDTYLRIPVTVKGAETTAYYTRFATVNNLSGYVNSGSPTLKNFYLNPDSIPNSLVIAKSMELKIKIQPEDNKINMPVLEIEYVSIASETYGTNQDISFIVTYTQDASNFKNTALPLFYTFAALAGLVWLFKFNIWSKYNPQSTNLAPETFFFLWVTNGINILINIWADFSFYYLFFMTGYWFVTYKFQENLYTLMINTSSESGLFKMFDIFIIIQYSFKLATFLKFVYKQLQTDVLFIDWENLKQYDDDTKEEEERKGISIWRQLFIANEFNELSVERVTSFEWTLFWVGFFLTGLSWDNLGLEVPYLTTSDKNSVRMNEALRYFISSALYMVIVLIQIVSKRLFIIWNPTPIQNFTDLCTVANVSIFIMDEQLHGYYLHGKSPNGVSEGNTFWLKAAIEKEGKTGSQRGLVKGDNMQTFETYIPVDLRFEYNQEYKTKYDNARAGFNQDQWVLARTVVKEMIQNQHLQEQKQHITNVIRTYITEIQVHSYNHVLHKSFLHRLLGLPPTNPLQSGLPFFFRDPAMNYCKIFYYGNEWFIVMFEMITFLFYNYMTGRPLVAIMITFAFNRILAWLRDIFGRRNISSKTMIDQRFLI